MHCGCGNGWGPGIISCIAPGQIQKHVYEDSQNLHRNEAAEVAGPLGAHNIEIAFVKESVRFPEIKSPRTIPPLQIFLPSCSSSWNQRSFLLPLIILKYVDRTGARR